MKGEEENIGKRRINDINEVGEGDEGEGRFVLVGCAATIQASELQWSSTKQGRTRIMSNFNQQKNSERQAREKNKKKSAATKSTKQGKTLKGNEKRKKHKNKNLPSKEEEIRVAKKKEKKKIGWMVFSLNKNW